MDAGRIDYDCASIGVETIEQSFESGIQIRLDTTDNLEIGKETKTFRNLYPVTFLLQIA